LKLDPVKVYEGLCAAGLDFFTGVPDSVLKPLLSVVEARHPASRHVIAANEGAAIGIAAGRYLATRKLPVVYLQNSGLGNAINPLLSLTDPKAYGIPLLLLIGWRGEPNTHDEPQHAAQGETTVALLRTMNVDCGVVQSAEDFVPALALAIDRARARGGPAALLFGRACLASGLAGAELDASERELPSRESAIEAVLEALSPADAVVASTGMIGRELYALRRQRGEDRALDFLNVGAMGHCSSIAAGIASARPNARVVCLDGDGALLMHLGALPINARLAPPTFVHIVLNNAAHDSVGGQPTVAGTIDLLQLARAAGYARAVRVTPGDELRRLLVEASDAGPCFVEIRVRRGHRGDLPRPSETFANLRDRFMTGLAGADA
jgi:phosphonopyruvate decarboxylase